MFDLNSLMLLKGKKALVTGVANDQSIAWGCAQAFRGFGAEIAMTYLNDKAKPHVEPLAKQLEAPILMPLDLRREGDLEAVFERIEREWALTDCRDGKSSQSTFAGVKGRVGRFQDCLHPEVAARQTLPEPCIRPDC